MLKQNVKNVKTTIQPTNQMMMMMMIMMMMMMMMMMKCSIHSNMLKQNVKTKCLKCSNRSNMIKQNVRILVHFSEFQYILVYFSVFSCILVYFSVFSCVLVYFSAFQYIVMLFSCIFIYFSTFQCIFVHFSVFQCILVYLSVFQCTCEDTFSLTLAQLFYNKRCNFQTVTSNYTCKFLKILVIIGIYVLKLTYIPNFIPIQPFPTISHSHSHM